MANTTKDLFVFANLDGEFVPAGQLQVDEEGSRLIASSFAYGLRYLDRGNAQEIDPVALSLKNKSEIKGKRLVPPNGLEAFGGIRDAAPDSWGRRVIEARLKVPANSLPESTYLLEAGSDRIGALDIRASLDQEERPAHESIHNLSYVLEGAQKIEAGLPVSEALSRILIVGSGLGGMRPKASVRDDDNILWMAKFPGNTDGVLDVPSIEYATLKLAELAGLNVAQTQLEQVGKKRVLMVKRFDRSWTASARSVEIRHHVISALTLVACHESESNTKSYMDIADAIRRYCLVQTVKSDVEELYARMIFNLFVSNDDDHLRNHAFLWNQELKGWSLSPLYDVMPHAVIASERYQHLGIGPQGKLATLDNAYGAKERFGLSVQQASSIIDRVWRVTRQWKTHFESLGIPADQIEGISRAFRHIDDICSPELIKTLAKG
ncbi:type II toxin-antitoxin system HipA family toxin [Polynucleobacter bastaniensis]|uniref:type II toxin-antitoxin system HipA family toxin n=1 Tax=Polynucleobacter bastaniensis TaxID=2081039 RepID=UPI001C0CCF92|nr:type II toxin-antitoxin system HipA family toxin [Polynucleobacter bastaniensis]MBU3598788.1 type II toxin-antitoxin system HipA family toxin [Polynucleobacter bastaniensis]